QWMIATIWQTVDEAPAIYEKTARFVEATAWATSQLTASVVSNSCTAGYKSTWHKQTGNPSKDFSKALDRRLEDITEPKLRGRIVPMGSKAGELTASMAEKIGLNEGMAISVGNVDAHVSVPAMGVTEPGKMVLTMGTSIC